MYRSALVALSFGFLSIGCAGMRSMERDHFTAESEGQTGCFKEEMKYTARSPDVQLSGTPRLWTIECRGKTFLCSTSGDNTASCHERALGETAGSP
jgi:hypothetical protein